MAFSIRAEFPLGTYRGAGPDGRPDRMPSVARLHAALLCAAGYGPRAQPSGEGMGPSEADEVALRWLEEHPPDAVSIPAMRVNTGRVLAYREDGTLTGGKKALRFNKPAKGAGSSVAFDGAFTWSWSEDPPDEVAAAFTALCPDVPHLGTTESPVRLVTLAEGDRPTHRRDPDAGIFAVQPGETLDVPVGGRLTELAAAHAATIRPPTAAQDRHKTNERSTSAVPPRAALAPARFHALGAPSPDAPWTQVVLLPLRTEVAEREKVRWAVATHRALIATIGEGAPPVLTGAYPPGTARPVNRVAVQIVDAHPAVDLHGAPAALALMIPHDAASVDVATILDAATELNAVRGPGGARNQIESRPWTVPGGLFWDDSAPDTVRVWRTAVPAVPDTRGDGPGWTFTHAALLSLGFVWRGSVQLPDPPGRAAQRHRALVAAVNAGAAVVLDAAPLRTSRAHDYVHRVNEHAVVRPYRACLVLGSFGGNRMLQAIGQSRHLGGGLLGPIDVPVGETFDISACNRQGVEGR